MMNEEESIGTVGLSLEYKSYKRQKCFVGHSYKAPWAVDLVKACDEVLPSYGLEPWYANDHFDPAKPMLLEKVLELIANTRYGIYDLSYWRKDPRDPWILPRNVFIELGVAIALNRPTFLLRHASNIEAGLKLPACLEGVSDVISFSGDVTFKEALNERLPQWVNIPPEQDWWNRYCTFGKRLCKFREANPRIQQWGQTSLCCHILDGEDVDRRDFRAGVEEVLRNYHDIAIEYLDTLSLEEDYDFLLCSLCQKVRAAPFAIYRITHKTPVESFIAIGMSLALEKQ